MNKLLILLIASALLFSCSETQLEFTHTITSTEGVSNAEVSYISEAFVNDNSEDENIKNDETPVVSQPLTKGDLVVKRVDTGKYIISVSGEKGRTNFTEIPDKYINMDADIEVTRNVFHDYFPEEWEPMKDAEFTSIYIKSKSDKQVFYMKAVSTGTSKEIGMYSEDY